MKREQHPEDEQRRVLRRDREDPACGSLPLGFESIGGIEEGRGRIDKSNIEEAADKTNRKTFETNERLRSLIRGRTVKYHELR
jgi:hypothetical protein